MSKDKDWSKRLPVTPVSDEIAKVYEHKPVKPDTSATRRARLIRALTMIQNVQRELPSDSIAYEAVKAAKKTLEAVLHDPSDAIEQFIPYIK